ncbi:unnamed protein product [Effrenium voratum]|nr:unnamed protein product [Effrenium voratum]CAJ1456886.1 unnamed protein product [Effrenium voratum]
MARRPVLGCVAAAAALASLSGVLRAFVAAPGAGVRATPAHIRDSARESQGNLMGVTCGMAASVAVAAMASRASRVTVKANPGAPSLIQVLEQKRLLSTLENLRLLSTAEKAGVKISTVEELGLLKLAEELNLLSFAENVLTSASTAPFMLIASVALGLVAYTVGTSPDAGFAQYFLAGALGGPALVLAAGAAVIFAIFGGARRTRNTDVEEKVLSYGANGFNVSAGTRPTSLLETVEQKRLLSFLEENRLLSLAGSVINKPLTTTESLRVLSTLEQTGLLSQLESLAAARYGAVPYGLAGAALLAAAVGAAVLVPNGLIIAALLALPGLALVAVGVAIGLIKPVVRSESF